MQSAFSKDFSPATSLRDLYYVVFRHKQKVTWFFLSVVVLVGVYSLLAPKIYRSEADLLVKIGRESVALDATVAPNQIVDTAAGIQRENEVNSEMEILKNHEVIARVVDTIGAESVIRGYVGDVDAPSPIRRIFAASLNRIQSLFFTLNTLFDSSDIKERKKREHAITCVLKGLNVTTLKKSNTISASYDAKSPQMAQKVLATVTDSFLDKHIQVHRTEGSYQFFVDQKRRLYDTLEKTSKDLGDLKTNTKITSIEDQRPLILKAIVFLKREVESTEAELDVSEAMVTSMRSELSKLPATILKQEVSGGALSASDEMLKRLNELQLRENEMLATFTEESIPIQELRRQIREAKAVLQQTSQTREVTTGINENRQRIQLNLITEEAVLNSLKAKVARLRDQLSRAEAHLNKMNEVEQRMKQLELDKSIQETSYKKYSDSLEQSLIDQSLEMVKISNIRLVQPATFPIKAISPRVGLNFLLAVLLGIFGGITLAFIYDNYDHSFGKPEDIEKILALPTLGAVNAVLGDKTSQKKSRSLQALPVKFDPSSKLMRDCDAIAERLITLTQVQESPRRVFSLTSSYAGEGVTSISAYLASSLARLGEGRVLLVDANFSNPLVHEIFGLSLSPGLADLAGGAGSQTALTKDSGLKNLDVLPAGRLEDANALKRIFESSPFSDLLGYWKREYAFIIFDSPAVGEEKNHAVTLGRALDGVIMVFEAERVRWEVAQRAKDTLSSGRANIIGAILNKRRFYLPKWLYGRL